MYTSEKGISLFDYVELLKKRWWMILLVSIIFASLLGYRVYSSYVPTYQTSTTILMHYNRSTTSSTEASTETTVTTSYDYSVGESVLSNFTGMLNSNKLRSQISEKIGSTNLGSISIAMAEGSIAKLSVIHTDPELAVEVANTTTEVLIEMSETMMADLNLSVLDSAMGASLTSGMGLSRSVMIGGVIGAVLSIGVILGLDLFKPTYESPKEVQKILELPIMGVIPDIEDEVKHYCMEKKHAKKEREGVEL